MHTALLTQLAANTRYLVQVVYDGKVQAQQVYKTIPDKVEEGHDITMINAGDVGTTDPALFFNQMLHQFTPDVFFVGGDIAYDDNFNSCFYTWDVYLGELEKVFQRLGYIFPLVLTVGNVKYCV